jgi:hypothetical protein
MMVEWWVVLATLAGPWIERASERGKRRQWIFTALMANSRDCRNNGCNWSREVF